MASSNTTQLTNHDFNTEHSECKCPNRANTFDTDYTHHTPNIPPQSPNEGNQFDAIHILNQYIFPKMDELTMYRDRIIDYFKINENLQTILNKKQQEFVNDLLKHIGGNHIDITPNINKLHQMLHEIALNTNRYNVKKHNRGAPIQSLEELYTKLEEVEMIEIKMLMMEFDTTKDKVGV